MTREEALKLRKKIEQASAWTDDADAVEMIELFPDWIINKSYIIGERIKFGNSLYKCLKEHISEAEITPDISSELWNKINAEEWPQWVRPTGSADAYMKGNKVTFESKHYISLIDENVKSPEESPQDWELSE